MPDNQNTSWGQYPTAVTGMRDTAKWLLTIAAGLAAAFTAGTQLSSIGHFTGIDARLIAAIVAAAVALFARGYMIWAAISVLVMGETTLDQLVQAERDVNAGRHTALQPYVQEVRDSEELRDGRSPANTFFQDLQRDYRQDLADRQVALRELANLQRQQGGTPQEQAQRQQAIQQRQETVADLGGFIAYLSDLISQNTAYVRYCVVLAHFERFRDELFVSGIVATLSIGVYAWAANPPPATAIAAQTPPFRATVSLNRAGQTKLRARLGQKCVISPVPVIVLGATSGSFTVVSIPSHTCAGQYFTVNGTTGIVTLPK